MHCKGCDKVAPYYDNDEFSDLIVGAIKVKYRCTDCGEQFWNRHE